MRYKILIVTSDTEMIKQVTAMLAGTELTLISSETAVSGIDRTKRSHPDLVLLDMEMPDMAGSNVCIMLKNAPETASVPIIVVSSQKDLDQKLECLKAGADDYVLKPFSSEELLMRIKVVLRRYNLLVAGDSVLTEGVFFLDSRNKVFKIDGRPVNLSAKEFELMFQLVKNRGKLLSRAHLLELIWGYSELNTRTLDVHIRFLRRKLGEEHGKKIITKHKMGYMLDY